MKVDILAIGVHPDDVELACSGTILKHIASGKKVALLDLTRGELGTRGSAKIREREALEAAIKMGAVSRYNCDMADGFFEHTEQNLKKIIPFIRHFQPEIVLANAIHDRHPDHGRAARLINDACFLSGLVKIPTEYEGKAQEKWRPKALYHYIQDRHIDPDFVIDITPFMPQKMELIMTFKSQFFNPDSKEPDSPISSEEFLHFIKARAKNFGRDIGVPYAEGFTMSRVMGVNSLFDLQ